MSLVEFLSVKEFGKKQTEELAASILKEKFPVAELVKLILTGHEPVSRRASWVLIYVSEADPSSVQPHVSRLVKNLSGKELHPSIIRNTLKCLEYCRIPLKDESILMELCFDYITSTAWLPAVQAFAMTVLEKLCMKYPELINEFNSIVRDSPNNEKPAYRSRARLVSRRLSKLALSS